jgi:hypothetical protein
LKMKLFHQTFEVMGLTQIHPSIRPYKSVCHCSYATYFLLLGAREFGVLQTEVVVVKWAKEIGCTQYKSITAISFPQSAICPIYVFLNKLRGTRACFVFITFHVMNVSKEHITCYECSNGAHNTN